MRRAGIGIEGGAHAEERAGEADGDHGDRGGDGIDAARVDADEAGRIGVFGGGADRAAERSAGEEQLQPAEQRRPRRRT